MGSTTDSWLTRSEAAAELGIGVHALTSWVERGWLPQPVRIGRGGRHHWRRADVDQAAHLHARHTSSHLSIVDVADRLGISPSALKSRRKRGLFPPPDGRDGRGPWWHHATLEAHLATKQVPDGAIVGLAAAAKFLQVPRSRIDLASLPRPDGHRSGVAWWHPATLTFTRRKLHQVELWTIDQISDRLNVSIDELHATPDMPAPVALNPVRWAAPGVREWWNTWWTTLRNNPDVLFSVDLPDVTGLTYDTIRTYRSKGRLPSPDGHLRGLPWWRRTTINEWITTRGRRTPGDQVSR